MSLTIDPIAVRTIPDAKAKKRPGLTNEELEKRLIHGADVIEHLRLKSGYDFTCRLIMDKDHQKKTADSKLKELGIEPQGEVLCVCTENIEVCFDKINVGNGVYAALVYVIILSEKVTAKQLDDFLSLKVYCECEAGFAESCEVKFRNVA